MRTATIVIALVITVFQLGGCAFQSSIKGKVIAGNLSFVCVVDQKDERLLSPGVPDVAVESRGDVGRASGSLLAESKSDANGDFVMTFREQAPLLKNVQFSGAAEGFLPASESMMIPASDRRVLIILKKKGQPPSSR